MLDIGGGFPARYAGAAPHPYEYGAYTREARDLLTALDADGIRLSMLDIGGGFPARYAGSAPDPYEYCAYSRQALDLLPYRPHVVAEPGRVLVADAGVLVSTVIGTATRA